jgi:hypothetical protein
MNPASRMAARQYRRLPASRFGGGSNKEASSSSVSLFPSSSASSSTGTCRFNALQARYFAGTSNNNNNNKTERPRRNPRNKHPSVSELENSTKQLLHEPSSWTLEHWRASEKALFSWTFQPQVSAANIHWSFKLLRRMAQEAQQNNETFHLTTKHVNRVIDRWRIGLKTRLLHQDRWSASRVLEIVEDYAEKVPSLSLDNKTYSMIMAVQIKQNPRKSSPFCTALVQRMVSDSTAPPNAVVLTYLMEAHVRGEQPNAVFATQSLFDFLVEKSRDDSNMAPTEKSLTRVLQAWVSLPGPTTTVEEALPHMKRNIQFLVEASQHNRRVLPNSLFVDLVLEDCSKQTKRDPSSLLIADALLTHVMELAVDHPHLLPNATTLSRMIFLWTKSSAVANAPSRAEYWLDEMCRLWKQVKSFDSPRYSVYAAVIAAWGKSELPQAPWHAERVWHRMIRDTSVATIGGCQTIVSLWSKAGEPERAEQILRELVAASESDQSLLPPVSIFVDAIRAWKQEEVKQIAANRAHGILEMLVQHKKIHPDRYDDDMVGAVLPFQICLELWAESGLPEAGSKADTILEWMKQEGVQMSCETLEAAIPCLSASKATDLLLAGGLLARDTSPNGKKLSQQEKCFEKVLQLWSASSDPTAGERAEHLLEHYFSLPGSRRNGERTMACFQHVVGAWKGSATARSPQKMKELLDRMSDAAKDSFQTTRNPSSMAKLAETCAFSGLSDSTEQTRDCFEQIVEHCCLHGDEIPSRLYENVIAAFAECGNVSEAETYLIRAKNDNIILTSKMYNPLIKVLAREISCLEKATAMLDEMVSSFIDGNEQAKPTADLFGLLIGAHARQRDTEKVQVLWRLLQRMQRHDPSDEEFQADSSALSGLASAGDHVGRDACILHHLLGEMSLRNEMALDEGTIQCVMEALSKSGDPKSGWRAEGILLKMQELYEDGVLNMEPTFDTFQKVIDSWVNSTEEGSAARANDVLTLAERLSHDGKDRLMPDHRGFLSVIEAWSKSREPDAPERILELVGKMKKRYDQGERLFALNGEAYAALIEAYSNSGNPEAAKLAKSVFDATPAKFKNTELYNALIGAQGGDAISAESILQDMHQGYVDGNEQVQPNTESFNQVLLAWSRSGSPMAAWRADGIFNRMNELRSTGQLPVKPNARTFDVVIFTLANELGADGALKVERYLELLKEYYRSGEPDCMPSATSYTEAIRAWGSNVEDPRSVLRAKALLDEMHELAREGISGVQPDRNTYSVYLQALARSTAEQKAEIAQDVAIMMKSDGIRPEGHLLEHLQRCLLPSTAVLSGWAVLLDERDTNEEEFINL